MCVLICKGGRIMTASKTSWETTEKVVYEISLRGGVKKGDILGQADCKLLSPTPPYGQLIVNFFCVLLTYIMIICVLKRILHMKKAIFIKLLESPAPFSGWPFARGLSLQMIICKSLAPPDVHLQESGSPRWSFARGRLLWMTICKRPVPPDDHLEEANPSGWSFARGRSLRVTICKRSVPHFDNHKRKGSEHIF